MYDTPEHQDHEQRERALIAAARRDAAQISDTCATGITAADEVPGYRLVRELGRGGMGVVYLAEQDQPRRAVALKMIGSIALADRHRAMMFEREIQILARLRHPDIGAIYDAGTTPNGRQYFAMELVRGAPLTDYASLADLPLDKRLSLFARICRAVHYAHQRGVIHRDLKPSNIIIDSDGNPKILDFGLARLGQVGGVSTASLEVGKIMGTLPYMSPEQARVQPEEIDIRSDVYSLGVVLYELMTERLPYDISRASPPEALRIISEEPPLRPGLIQRHLRGDLETIVLKALAKEPYRRYDTAAALADDVDRYLRHEPIMARPPSAGYLLGKWILRRRSTAALLGILLLVVVGFGIAFWIQATWMARAREAIRLAEEPTITNVRIAEAARLREIAGELEEVGVALMEDEQYAAAEIVLLRARSLLGEVLGEGHWQALEAQSLLGECLVKLESYEQAERLLLDCYRRLDLETSAGRGVAVVTAERLSRLYDAWGWPDQSLEWQAKAEAIAAETESATD